MSKRPVAEDEIIRILAMVPWLIEHPGVHKDEIAAQFGVSRKQLEQDLIRIMMIGVPPYTPDCFVTLDDEGDHVTVFRADWFHRNLDFSPAEGLAVLAAGQALLGVPGSERNGALVRALDKLAAALGNPDVTVAVPTPEHLGTVREAAAEHRSIELDYISASGAVTTRTVDPHCVFFAEGSWYVETFCHRANDERMFRIDRIRDARVTADRFEPIPDWIPRDVGFVADASDPRVTLELMAQARWVTEYVACEDVVDGPDGSQHVTIAYREPAFVEDLLVRLGPTARMVGEPPSDLSAARRADRVLARYGAEHR